MDKSGNIKAVVIGVGGFLGVGEHLVALPLDKVKFVNEPIVYTGAAGRIGASGTRPASTTTTGAANTAPRRDAGEAQSVVSGPCRDQRHQGSAEGDARVQIRDLTQRSLQCVQRIESMIRNGRTAALPPGHFFDRRGSGAASAASARKHVAPHPFGTGIPMLGLPCGRSTCVLPDSNGRTTWLRASTRSLNWSAPARISWEKAAAAAVNRAGKSLRDLRVAEVVQLDMQLDAKGKIEAYRAKLKVSFKFEG